jgi:hypothetical protein
VADDVSRKTADVAAPQRTASAGSAASASRAERARRTAYRGRFAIIYLVLAGVAGAAVGATIVLVGRGSPAPAPPWSDWQPEGSAERRAVQIADRISGSYRLSDEARSPLVSALAGPPSAPTADGSLVRMRAIVVRPQTARGQQEADDNEYFDAGKSMMFLLCSGVGRSCSLSAVSGTPEVYALLRRQALELALYTFTYVDDIETVVVVLPNRVGQQVANAVFIERTDVRRELADPVIETLTAPTTPDVGAISSEERRVVDRITRPRLYTYQYDAAADGSPVMILTPALV